MSRLCLQGLENRPRLLGLEANLETYLDGLGLGLGHLCHGLGLSLGGPGLDYNPGMSV